MQIKPLSLTLRVLLLGTSSISLAWANQENVVQLEDMTITISADASRAGLMGAYGHGDIARGARIGVLGNQDTMDSSFSATAYTNQFIKNSQSASVGDVLKKEPSVQVARGFGNFQEAYLIRGFVTTSDDTMYNGLYGVLPRQYIASELFERVQLQRGATATLNGMSPSGGNIGGTISLLPKRASNTPKRQVTLSTQNGQNAKVALDVGQRFGVDNAFGVRANVVHQSGGTLIDDEDKKVGLFNVGLDYYGKKARLSADLGYQNHQMDATRSSVTLSGVSGVPNAPSMSRNWSQPWTYSNEKTWFGTLRGEYELGKQTDIYGAYGFRRGEESNRLANITVNNINGDGTIYRFDNERKDDVSSFDVGMRHAFDLANTHHKVTLSYNGTKMSEKNAYNMDYFNAYATNLYNPTIYGTPFDNSSAAFVGGDLNNPKKVSDSTLTGITLADQVAFFDDRLQASLALRHQRIDQKNYDYNTGAYSSGYKDDKLTPSVGLIYRITPQVSVYGNYIESLAKGQTAPTSHNGNAVTNAGQNLAPYVSKQKEVGLKYDNGETTGTLSVFDVSQPRALVNASNTYVESGKNQHRGVELSAYHSPVQGLRLLGGVGYLDAKQKGTDSSSTEGKTVIGAAKWRTNVGVEYDLPQLEGLTLTGNISHSSKRYADNANTLLVDGYTLLDIGARYKTRLYGKEISLTGSISNLTGEKYWTSVGGYPDNGYLVAGEPTAFKLSASMDF